MTKGSPTDNRFRPEPLILASLLLVIHLPACGRRKPPDLRRHEQGLIYLQKSRNYTKAIEEFRKALEINPNRPDTLYYLGRAYILAQRYEEALETFNRLQDVGDSTSIRRAYLGWTDAHLARAGQRLAAAGTFTRLSQFDPIRDDLDAAANYAEKYPPAGPDDAEGLLRQARVAVARHRLYLLRRDLLRQQARRAREHGNNTDAEQLSSAAQREDRAATDHLRQACLLFEKVVSVDPKQVDAYRRLIEASWLLGDLDRAESAARRLLQVQANDDRARLTLARVALRRWESAVKDNDDTSARRYLAAAKKRLLAVLEVTPQHEQANLLMSRLSLIEHQTLAAKQKVEEARKALDAAIHHADLALTRNPNLFTALYYRGWAFFLKKDYSKAILDLEKLSRRGLEPTNPEEAQQLAFIHKLLAIAYMETASVNQAVEAFRQAVHLNPRDSDALARLVEAYISLGRLQDARQIVQRQVEPVDPSLAEYLRGRILLVEADNLWAKRDRTAEKLRQQAAEHFRRAIQLNPNSPLAESLRVDRMISAGSYEEAIKTCDQILSRSPANLYIRQRKAQALAYLGRFYEALSVCRENLARDPAHDETHALIMDIYLRCRRPDLAIRHGEKAPAGGRRDLVDRRLMIAYLRRARTRKAQGRVRDLRAAIAAAERVLRTVPGLAEARLVTAEAYRRLGEYTAAAQWLDRTIQQDTGDARLLHAAADIAMLAGDLTRAQRLFQQALSTDPNHAVSVYPLGMVLVAEGRYREAAKLFRQATRLRAYRGKHYLGLVVSLEALGRVGEALEVAAQAIEALVPYEPLELANVRLLLAAGRPGEALTALQALTQRHRLAGIPPLSPIRTARLRAFIEDLKTDPERAAKVALEINLAEFFHLGLWHRLAIEHAEAARKLAPGNLDCLVTLLRMLEAGGEQYRQRALKAALDLTEADPKSPAVHYLLAKQYERVGQLDEAEKALRRAVELAPNDADLRFRLATFLEQRAYDAQTTAAKKAFRDKALATYRAAANIPNLERNPSLAYWIYNNLAYLLATHAGDLTSAEKFAHKAERLAESTPLLLTRNPWLYGTILDTVGWIQYLTGKRKEAVLTLERANILCPLNPILTYHLAMAYLAVGQRDKARTWLERAIEIRDERFEDLDAARQTLEKLKREPTTTAP